MTDVLKWIDFSMKSMKMTIVGLEQDEDLKKDLKNKAQRSAQYKQLHSEMAGISQKSSELFREQISGLKQFIETEYRRIERKGDQIDPEYKAAFEQKAEEAKDFMNSTPLSLRW